MIFRTIETAFWDDERVKALPPDGKLLFLYLITNRHAHVSGIYYLSTAEAAQETGLTADQVDTLWHTLSSAGLASMDRVSGVVWVKKMLDKQGRGPKSAASAAAQLRTLHKCSLIKDFLEFYKHRKIPYSIPYGIGYPGAGGLCPQEQEQDQEQDKEDEAAAAATAPPPEPSAEKGKGKVKPAVADKPPPPYRRFTDEFCREWQRVHKAKYPFQKKDGPAAAEIWKYAGQDIRTAMDIVERYLLEPTPFFAGHPLAKLASNLSQFAAADPDGIGDPSRAGGRDPTPEEIAIMFGRAPE